MTKQTESKIPAADLVPPPLPYEQACREVWDKLSQVNCNEHTETKGDKIKLTYLSWVWAVDTMMKNFPTFDYEMHLPTFFANGTAEVTCTTWVTHGAQRIQKDMWLPVMDHRNKAIVNPDSVAINKSKMRCLTKAISMFGLGAYIFAGEDLPAEGDDQNTVPPQATQAPVPPQANQMLGLPPNTSVGVHGELNQLPPPANAAPMQYDVPQTVAAPEVVVPTITDESAAEEMTEVLVNIARSMHSDSLRSLTEFWMINKATIDVLDSQYPNQYAKLKAAFTEIKQSFTQPQEAPK